MRSLGPIIIYIICHMIGERSVEEEQQLIGERTPSLSLSALLFPPLPLSALLFPLLSLLLSYSLCHLARPIPIH